MITVLPVKKRSRAQTTRPAFGALIGVPLGLRKSVPPWGLRGSPLKTLLVPNELLASFGTGRTNGPDQSRVAAGRAYTSARNAWSARMRVNSAGDGFTKAGSTRSVLVGNFFGATTSARDWCNTVDPTSASTSTRYRPGR